MYSIFQRMSRKSPQPTYPVLISGETGVGKELIAKAIHNLSGRDGGLVPVNVAGLNDELFSDARFSATKKGRIPARIQIERGLLRQASNGTLFLDEIGDLQVESQVKLLRLISKKGRYFPLGENSETMSRARVVFATNREIQYLRDSENFRTDLYYRLKSHRIHLPPLRERLEDIPMLLAHFLESAAKEMDKSTPAATKEVLDLLGTHSFPGNVRELQGMVTNAVNQTHRGCTLHRFFSPSD